MLNRHNASTLEACTADRQEALRQAPIMTHAGESLCRFSEQFKLWQPYTISNLAGNLSFLFGIILWVSCFAWVRRHFFEVCVFMLELADRWLQLTQST